MKTLNRSEGQGVAAFSECSFHSESPHFLKFNLNEELKNMNQEEEEKLGTIYIATNLVNGKQNVGQTIRSLKKRIDEHKKAGYLLHKAIKKYGFENFKVISFSCPEEDLDWTETFLIAELNALAPNGYNLKTGGHENKHHYELTKQKMSDNHWDYSGENNPFYGKHQSEKSIQKIIDNHPDQSGENNPMFGKHHSKESRQRMSDSNKGKHFLSEETRQRMSESQSGENNPMWGKHHSEKSRQKISESLLGGKNPMAKPVILISPEGIEYSLPCFTPFCREHNLNHSNISQVLQGKRKHHKGWTGKYVENNK